MNYSTENFADAYYRLSVEESNEGESSSITNQKSIVRQYCNDNGITLVNEFVDDGFSGSNFNRPAFTQMINHLKKGYANMVITKDLSRLGRDMSESSYYAETYFPEHNIRYIAIGDNFDSYENNILAPFQFAMNDVYLRDISKKIKQVYNQKMKNGEYCVCPPFGYIKNPYDKKLLVPDSMTAPIVQRIFNLAAQGKSAHTIAKILTDDGVITPLKYRALYRDNFTEKGVSRVTDEWNHTTVKRILKNQVYLGHTLLGKTKKVSIKSKRKIAVPEDKWFVTKNTHQPLVTQEQFNQAMLYMAMNTTEWQSHSRCRKNIFNGITYCASCGGAMCSSGSEYKGEREKYWYLSCINIPKRSKKHCENGARILYSDLIEIVKLELNELIKLNDEEIEQIVKNALEKSSNSNIYKDVTENKKNIEKRLKAIDEIVIKLYGDNTSGIISDNMLKTMILKLSAETDNLRSLLATVETKKSTDSNIVDDYQRFFSLVKQYTHIDVLTEETVRTFIDRIEINKKKLHPGYQIAGKNVPYKQRITIYYRFIGKL